MICQCSSPGICPVTGRRVRWAEIQSCQSWGPPGSAPEITSRKIEPSKTCRDCVYCGDPAIGESGKQIGSKGCGCPNEIAGILWWTCGLDGQPTAETRAKRCENYERSESP